MAHQEHTIAILLDDGGPSGWTLKISRANNSTHYYFTLHWKNKDSPSHLGLVSVDYFDKALGVMKTVEEVE